MIVSDINVIDNDLVYESYKTSNPKLIKKIKKNRMRGNNF